MRYLAASTIERSIDEWESSSSSCLPTVIIIEFHSIFASSTLIKKIIKIQLTAFFNNSRKL